MLVVSPTAAYSSRRSEPTLPDMTGPLHTPMPMENGSPIPRSATQRVELRQPLAQHLARGRDGPVGVVVLLERRAEDRHDPVALVADEGAAVVEDRVAHLA